jgi:3-dehydroquinate dehydratase-1
MSKRPALWPMLREPRSICALCGEFQNESWNSRRNCRHTKGGSTITRTKTMTAIKPILVQGRPLAGGALPIIITPLVGKTEAAILDEVAAIVPKKPDLLEWRIDFFEAIGDVAAVIKTAQAIRKASGGIPVLLTRRNASEGGAPIAIKEPQVLAMYVAACEARCVELIDYELSNAPADLKRLREVSKANGVAMIMSYHNFQQTPDDATLAGKFAAAESAGADVAKVAVMPKDEPDVLRLLAATYRASQTLKLPLISMSMGGIGSLSRIMGWVYGSAATFAVGKSSSAPGQIAIEDLRACLATVRKAVTGN